MSTALVWPKADGTAVGPLRGDRWSDEGDTVVPIVFTRPATVE